MFRNLVRGVVATAAVASALALQAAPAQAACSPLACSEILVDLPYTLDFSSDHGKIDDGNGVGTGFTYVQPTTNGTGYIPGNLLVDTSAPGLFKIDTTSGSAYQTRNSLDNGLGVGIDAPSQVTRLETTLRNLPAGTGNYEQAGLWFGNNEDNYVKLIVIHQPNGIFVVFDREVDGVRTGHVASAAQALTGHDLTLSLIVDPGTETISPSYRVDGGAASSLQQLAVPPEFFSFDGARIDPEIGTDSFGGVFASHEHNGPASLTYAFDDFSVTKERDVAPDPLTQGVAFQRSSFPVPFPTSMAWGPDGRLYVSELFGTIHALTLDADKQVVNDQVIDSLGSRLTLGITIDPLSTPENVILWASHSSPSVDQGTPNSGIVSRLSGPGFATREDVITGLPRAIANHGTNSIHFGPDGRLYIAQGGNTGAGAPNSSDSEFGDMQEQPLSAALLVADVEDPQFDGSCNNESDIFGPPPCDVQTYSTGLRNTYDFAFHQNGNIYGPDNGLGVTGTFPPAAEPPCFGLADPAPWNADPPGQNPGQQPDELNLLVQGGYYGHPDPYRDECVFNDGSYQGTSPLASYHPPMFNLGNHRSANGIIDYHSSAHCGALNGDLLITNYSIGDDVTRVQLSDDGQSVTSVESLATGFDNPLPIAQGPDGTIYVGESGDDQVTALSPVNIGCWANRASLPVDLLDAGGTALGGKLYVVGGKDAVAHRSAMYVYDPAGDSWTTGPDLPGPAVENPAVTAHGGKLYVFGGSTAPFSGAVSNAAVFDPATGEWTALTQMPTARGGATAQALDGKIYVAGGMSAAGASLSTLEVFDPVAGTWTPAAPMSTRRDNPGSAVLNDHLYLFGGRTRDADGTVINGTLASVEMYDPTTDSWTGRAPMPTGRRTMAVGTLNGRAQLVGGEGNPSTPGTFAANEEYDPDADSWRTLTPEPTPRHGSVGGTIGEVLYVVGGGPSGGSSFSRVNEAFSFNSLGGPGVQTGSASADQPTTATLHGTVNPNGSPTVYHFQYGTDAGYGSVAPVPDGNAGSGGTDLNVTEPIGGLAPDTTYHYRLVAVNGSGTAFGADRTFHTPGAEDHTAPATRILGKRIQLSRSGIVRILLRCPAAEVDPSCAGRLRLLSAHRLRSAAKPKGTLLGARGFKVPSGQSRLIRLRLKRSARRLVARLGSLRVIAVTISHDLAGNKGVSRHALNLLAP